jgi:hypothetical protein
MESTVNVKTMDEKVIKKFCPYKGEFDWQIECIGARCMKFDVSTSTCTRN